MYHNIIHFILLSVTSSQNILDSVVNIEWRINVANGHSPANRGPDSKVVPDGMSDNPSSRLHSFWCDGLRYLEAASPLSLMPISHAFVDEVS